MSPRVQLSEHFWLDEFTNSHLAVKLGLDNTPSAEHVANLRALCVNLLEPVRFFVGRPIVISSGFRSPTLNAATGGSPTSDHCNGRAADIEVQGVDNCELAHMIAEGGFVFDQVILEFYKYGTPDSGWCHVSWRPEVRYQIKTARRNAGDARIQYVNGLP